MRFECFDVVESVDRLELAAELQKRLELAGKKMRIMVEVNVGGEAAKHGCSAEEVGELLQSIQGHSRLEVIGLMAIPPFREDPEMARPFFSKLREIRDRLQETTRCICPSYRWE